MREREEEEEETREKFAFVSCSSFTMRVPLSSSLVSIRFYSKFESYWFCMHREGARERVKREVKRTTLSSPLPLLLLLSSCLFVT